MYQSIYKTPDEFSDMVMYSDGIYLTELGFEKSENAETHTPICEAEELPVFQETRRWLDQYFAGQIPDFTPKYRVDNLTPFRKDVIEIMTTIPYGETMTYGEIAQRIAKKRGIKRMSAQAVGGAVGWNPIGVIIPCHRVLGANGRLTGYGGGLSNKIALLRLEGVSDY